MFSGNAVDLYAGRIRFETRWGYLSSFAKWVLVYLRLLRVCEYIRALCLETCCRLLLSFHLFVIHNFLCIALDSLFFSGNVK